MSYHNHNAMLYRMEFDPSHTAHLHLTVSLARAHVWSIVCFFVAKLFRNKGISTRLLRAAVQYVRKQGGKTVEGYPDDPKKSQKPGPFVFTGLVSAFRKAEFTEVSRRSETRPIMRYAIGNKKGKDAHDASRNETL